MKNEICFAVIYRWKLRAGMEQTFQEAWQVVTELIMAERGGLGSRLHQSDGGDWIAYAQWPSKGAWEKSRALGSVSPAASEQMSAAIEESYDPVLLDLVSDLLVS
jgi:quinol monooxygenase YgiN